MKLRSSIQTKIKELQKEQKTISFDLRQNAFTFAELGHDRALELQVEDEQRAEQSRQKLIARMQLEAEKKAAEVRP